MAEFIEIITLIEGVEQENKFTSTSGVYHLGNMLLDWKGNCYTDYNQILNQEEIEIISANYGKESISVQEGDVEFAFKSVSVFKLLAAMTKTRNYILYPILKDAWNKNNDSQYASLTKDVMIISECIGFLEYIKNITTEVYIAIEDC